MECKSKANLRTHRKRQHPVEYEQNKKVNHIREQCSQYG